MTLLSLLIGGIMMVSATQGGHAGEVKEQAKHTAPTAQHATVQDETKKEMSHDMKKMCEEMKKNNPEMKQKCEEMKKDNPDMKKKCEEMKAGMKSEGEKKDDAHNALTNAEKPKTGTEQKNHQH